MLIANEAASGQTWKSCLRRIHDVTRYTNTSELSCVICRFELSWLMPLRRAPHTASLPSRYDLLAPHIRCARTAMPLSQPLSGEFFAYPLGRGKVRAIAAA